MLATLKGKKNTSTLLIGMDVGTTPSLHGGQLEVPIKIINTYYFPIFLLLEIYLEGTHLHGATHYNFICNTKFVNNTYVHQLGLFYKHKKIEDEKTFVNIWYPFKIKTLRKFGIEGYILNLMRVLYQSGFPKRNNQWELLFMGLFIIRIGPHRYGGWEVPQFAVCKVENPENRWYCLVPVESPENWGQWCKSRSESKSPRRGVSMSEGKRWMCQVKQTGLPFCSIQTLNRLGDAYQCW